MSDELFEVAFSGQISEGADIERVKVKVAAIFKADAGKLAQLFSGKRVVIKKNIDQAMANKYKVALQNAGAVCEVKSLSTEPAAGVIAKPEVAAAVPVIPVTASAPDHRVPDPVSAPAAVGDIPSAPQTAPLGINANDISELSVSLAPLGSDMQDEHELLAAPEIDVSGLDVAPVGSDLGQSSKVDEPLPMDTSGLSIAD